MRVVIYMPATLLLPCSLIAMFGVWLAFAERRAAIVSPVLPHRS
jgi:hypothetical protein